MDRYKVIGLTDSLFYNHHHDRIWLPELMFAGSGCFAKLKLNSIHNIYNFGTAVFDDLDAELILDINRDLTWNKAWQKMKEDSTWTESKPLRLVRFDTKMMKYVSKLPVLSNSVSATAKNYDRWILSAFQNDEKIQAERPH